MPARLLAYNPVVRCHAGKTAGFVLAERHLTLPSDSANNAKCGPNGKRTFNPGVEGSNPSRPSTCLRRHRRARVRRAGKASYLRSTGPRQHLREIAHPNLRPSITAIIRGRLAWNPNRLTTIRPIELSATGYGLTTSGPATLPSA